MRRFAIFGAVAALILAFAGNSVCAQTATSEPVGKPLPLLAGLRPPHEARHKHPRHVARAVPHARAAHEKTVARTRHARIAAPHARHVTAKKLAKREYEHRERRYERHEGAVAASAFAEEPPPQAASDPTPDSAQPVANAAFLDSAAAPSSANAAPNVGTDTEPAAAKIQTVKITPPSQSAVAEPTGDVSGPAGTAASAEIAPSDHPTVAPPPQTAVAAAAEQQKAKNADPVGSSAWIAQVLAALGGAVAAGAVAWFLIGGGPVRTYG